MIQRYFLKQILKKGWIFLFLWSPFWVVAQNLDSCGINNSSLVTENEAIFLNNYLNTEQQHFDFRGKKVAFVKSSGGMTIISKKDYFDGVKERPLTGEGRMSTFCIFFTEKEKQESGGYDVILTKWVKLPPNHRKLAKKLAQSQSELSSD